VKAINQLVVLVQQVMERYNMHLIRRCYTCLPAGNDVFSYRLQSYKPLLIDWWYCNPLLSEQKYL